MPMSRYRPVRGLTMFPVVPVVQVSRTESRDHQSSEIFDRGRPAMIIYRRCLTGPGGCPGPSGAVPAGAVRAQDLEKS